MKDTVQLNPFSFAIICQSNTDMSLCKRAWLTKRSNGSVA